MLFFLFKNKIFRMANMRKFMKMAPEAKKRANQWLMGLGALLLLVLIISVSTAMKSGETLYWVVASLSCLMVYAIHFKAFSKIDEETLYELKDLMERSRPLRRFVKGPKEELCELEVSMLMKMQFMLSERRWAKRCKQNDLLAKQTHMKGKVSRGDL
jgi:hypothetical protein